MQFPFPQYVKFTPRPRLGIVAAVFMYAPLHLAYTAVKANDHPAIIKVLASLGCGFDCGSRAEVERVLALSVNPASIVYANPHKQPDHVQ